jgi:hypothetical protein
MNTKCLLYLDSQNSLKHRHERAEILHDHDESAKSSDFTQ